MDSPPPPSARIAPPSTSVLLDTKLEFLIVEERDALMTATAPPNMALFE
jgi:hypothetical protein